MKKRKSHEPNHNWNRFKFHVEIDGRQQEAKSCTRCGMERTRDPGTKSLYLFREAGASEWKAFKAGVLPACEPRGPQFRMTLDEFEARLRHQVKSFFEFWRQERAKSPSNYQLEMSSAERRGPTLEWEDQFRAWLDDERSEP